MATVEPAIEAESKTESTDELEAIYRERMEEARNRYTDADVDFMTGMIAHHAQALVMSRLAPTHEASPAVRTLTARINNAQNDEIATMQQWLRDRGQPVPEVHIEGLSLMIHGCWENTICTCLVCSVRNSSRSSIRHAARSSTVSF